MKRVNILSEEEQKVLEDLYHYNKTRRVRLRSHILLLSNKGNSINDLIKIFSLDFDTVSDLISAYNNIGVSALYDKPRSGRPHLFLHKMFKIIYCKKLQKIPET